MESGQPLCPAMVEGVGETGPQQLESLLTNSDLPPIVMQRICQQPRAKLSLQYGAIPQRDLSPSWWQTDHTGLSHRGENNLK